ncbi:hypothetical protein ACPF3S_002825 [Vibrio cholerae]|uniref:hypothetical protein n=1 Tax=Vibrio cholerae TaxID=666 RepID=UPI00053C0F16|nr:hypothetical protein [Vibrio cholerae]AOY46081.1 hypothetical protein NH62_10862 [Vibrio cholerae]AOY49689.1 hypothetical protein AP033_10866 [Vibrio cholerae]EGQ9464115.1 hypothetical protein [Vibrio cholerae]EGR1329805.1 hypothetical protein [Vibrio cholerae]EGR2040929.1 hypothetical protein [Vibrio cholerae]
MDVVDFFKNKTQEFWWKVLSYLVSTFVLVPNVAMMLFLVYMAEYNFFSYDFFLEGVFGMKWFFLTTVLFLIVTASILYSPMIFWFLYKKRNLTMWPLWLMYGLFFVGFWVYAGILIYSDVNPARVIFVAAICLFVAIHVIVLTCYSAKAQFISMAALIFAIVYSSLNYSAQVAEVVSIGLKAFGVGGDLPIVVKGGKNDFEVSGKLKLITPQNIYMVNESGSNLLVYSLSHVSSYSIKIE